MAKIKKTKTPAEPEIPLIDPILPLPFDSRPIPVRNGEGPGILANTSDITLTITSRAFWILWEKAEEMAKRNYEKHSVGPFENHAKAILEACYGFRNAWHRQVRGSTEDLVQFSEAEAQKLRNPKKKAREQAVPTQAGCTHSSKKPIKSKKTGKKQWKCLDCGEKWTRTGTSEQNVSAGKIKTKKARSGNKKRR